MTLKDLIENLFYGELSSFSVAEKEITELNEKELNKFIFLTNSALLDLHTRFNLIEKTVFIESLVWKSNYELNSKYSFLNTDPNELKYIRDTPHERFKDDVIKIIGVKNEIGADLPLNNSNEWASVFTPSYNVVQITHPYYGQAFQISYQASHPKLILKENLDETLSQEISLAPPLLEVLFVRIAAKYFGGMSGQESTSKSQELTMKYEQKCEEIFNMNQLGDSENITNVKNRYRGFP